MNVKAYDFVYSTQVRKLTSTKFILEFQSNRCNLKILENLIERYSKLYILKTST